MKRTTMLRAALGGAALLLGLAPAQADYQVSASTAAANAQLTVCGFSVSTVNIPCHGIVDSAKQEMFKAANPGMVGLTFGGSALTLGQKAKAGSLPVALPTDPDILSTAATITAADGASTTATGQNSVSVVTGTPTTGSVYSVAVNGQSEADFTVGNVFVGTLQFEGSANGGLAWTPRSAHVMGTKYRQTQVTGPGVFHINAAGLTHIRVRAIALTSGTPSIQLNTTPGTGSIYIMNDLEIVDNATGLSPAIKAGGAATPTDPAMTVQDPTVAAAIANTAVQTTAPGGTHAQVMGVEGAPAGNPVNSAETGTAAPFGGLTPVVGFASSIVCKAAGGNLYSAYGQNPNNTPFYLVALNQTAPPAAGGTITAANVLDARTVPANGDGGLSYGAGPAKRFGAGIAVIATTSLATFTAPTTAPFLSTSCL